MHNSFTYAQISKIDNEERVVEGIASTEAIDSQGDIVTAKAMAAAIPEFMKLPGGGNLREMHQPKAAGKIPFMKQDENGNTIITAKIVDDEAWKKIKEQVYTGFSIGGRAKTKQGNKITALDLSEISLVDRPSNPKSFFTLVKLDMAKDKTQDPEVKNQAEEIAADVVDAIDASAPVVEAETEVVTEVTAETVAEVAPEVEAAPVVEAEVIVSETKQSADVVSDIKKLEDKLDLLISKLDKPEAEVEAEIAKVDGVEFAKADYVKGLEERLNTLEKHLSAGTKAKFVTISKFDDKKSEVASDKARLAEIQDAIQKNTYTEEMREEGFQILRKLREQGTL